jgi:hypothetical protein
MEENVYPNSKSGFSSDVRGKLSIVFAAIVRAWPAVKYVDDDRVKLWFFPCLQLNRPEDYSGVSSTQRAALQATKTDNAGSP